MMERSSSRLKQRITRMFRASSLLRSSCTTTTTTTNLSTSSSSNSSINLSNDIPHEPVFIPHRHHLHRRSGDDLLFFHNKLDRSVSFRSSDNHHRTAPTVRHPFDCGGCWPTTRSEEAKLSNLRTEKEKYKKKERRVTETGVLYETGEWEGRTCPPASPETPSKNYYYYYYCKKMEEVEKEKGTTKNKIEKKKKKKLISNSYGFSSSSVDSDNGFGFISSDDDKEEETETFFSSRSFSSDSSEFYHRPSPNTKKNKNNNNTKKNKSSQCPPRRRRKNHICNGNSISDGFRPVVSVASRKKKVEEEAESGFAVVKQSSDPYADFRSSMVEMIVDRQLFGARDLERLLRSYLSLNSPHHHPIILQAFSDIWEVLFGN